MSFKRDGDDKCLLKNLNDQRVRELLGNHVPQDEAKLLSNGRLTCTICIHRPIFDTINMLANHRMGNRHLSELSKYIKSKEESERKLMQRKQDLLIDSQEGAQFKIAPTEGLNRNQRSSLGHKRAAVKQSGLKHQRKPILEIRVPHKTVSPDSSNTRNPEKQALSTVRHYLKSITRKISLEKVVERNQENYGIDLQRERTELLKKSSSTSGTDLLQCEKTSSKTADLQEYELKLRMSGWIKDSTGEWMKDPNVEFDSDEETPPPPP